MNKNIENNPTDDAMLDRLVDGQLSDEQRHELLASLDDEPGGWRRCALAFLEAQCWKEALGKFVSEESSLPITAEKSEPLRSPWTGRIATLTAMAASFVLAMWIGWRVQNGNIVDPGNGRLGNIAQNAVPPPPSLNQSQPTKPWEVVTVSTSGSDGRPSTSFNVPARERKAVDKQWLESVPPPIPVEVREALARTGHEVKQHRELVPVPMKDGRKLVMPVDKVDVHYVGNGPY